MKDLIRQATELIAKSKHHAYTQFRHVSFLIQNGEVIEYGWNHQCDNPPPIYADRRTIHSEYHAWIRAIRKNRLARDREWSMVNVRLLMDYSVGLSKPCSKCQTFLASAGCEEVSYSSATVIQGSKRTHIFETWTP